MSPIALPVERMRGVARDSARWRRVALKLFVFAIAWCGIVGLLTVDDYRDRWLLQEQGEPASGRVVRYQPDRHGSLVFDYEVAGRRYRSVSAISVEGLRPLESYRPGEPIPVTYLPARPETAMLGTPPGGLESEYLRIVGLITLALAVIIAAGPRASRS